jgi:hypothetical protein
MRAVFPFPPPAPPPIPAPASNQTSELNRSEAKIDPADVGPEGWSERDLKKQFPSSRLSVDGKLVSESDVFKGDAFKLDSDGPLKIGFGQHDYFNGRMKDVRIYDRALSAKRIREIWDAK